MKPSAKKIAFAGPWITQHEVNRVTEATWNGFYENYDGFAKKLEKTVADYVGVKYALATHCCTHALHLATAALGLQPGDEVITTDFSWVATAYAVSYTGAQPVFVDIEPETWTIDPEAIKRAITPKSKAIMLVHTFGQPANMSVIMDLARENNLAVIEDAAPALGAEHKNKKVGGFGDFGCFSFQGAKLTVSGEGGIILTNNEALFQKVKLLASMGRTDSKANFWSDSLGYQYTIANLTAALALAQVERVDELIAKKRQIFAWYESRLKNVSGIKMIKETQGNKSNYCYPSIFLRPELKVDRNELLMFLKDLNVHCRPGFPRMSEFPIYSAQRRFHNAIAESVEKRGISLASAANLEENDIDFVCEGIIQYLKARA
jgi:perosamine synthetase